MITKLYMWFQIPDDDSSSPHSTDVVFVTKLYSYIGLLVVIA